MKSDIRAAFADGHKAVLAVAPTGSGKTEIIARIADDAIAQGLTCLIAVHRPSTLISQTVDKLQALGVKASIIRGGDSVDHGSGVWVASLQSLARREIPKVDLVILDEAHTTSFYKQGQRIFDELPHARFIGFTATPWRLNKTQSLRQRYTAIVTSPGYQELIAAGYLVQPRHFAYKGSRLDLSKVGTVNGDYKPRALDVLCNSPFMIQRAVDELITHGRDRQTICFTVSCGHAIALVEALRLHGFSAEAITGATPDKERAAIFQRFDTRQTQCLVSVGVLTEGYDAPIASCILMVRPTLSRALYVQMVGRGLRPNEGKQDCIIADLADNYTRHGLVANIDNWTLDGAIGVAETLKCCPSCGRLVSRMEPTCPNCGHVFAGNRDGNGKNPRGQDVDLDLEEVIDGRARSAVELREKQDEAKSLYDGGMSFGYMAKHLGVAKSTIYNWKKTGGWEIRVAPEQDKRKQQAQRLFEDKRMIEAQSLFEGGMSFGDMAKQLGLSKTTIHNWKKTGGWEIRVDPEEDKRKLEAQSLFEGGMSFGNMAKQLGLSKITIHNWKKTGGWEIRVDPEEDKRKLEAQSLFEGGVSLEDIAKELGVTRYIISGWARGEGWERDWESVTEKHLSTLKQQVQKLLEGGTNFLMISQRLGIEFETLHKWIKAGGWKLNNGKPDLQKVKAQELVEGGANFSEAARQLESDPTTIRGWSKDGNWQRPKP